MAAGADDREFIYIYIFGEGCVSLLLFVNEAHCVKDSSRVELGWAAPVEDVKYSTSSPPPPAPPQKIHFAAGSKNGFFKIKLPSEKKQFDEFVWGGTLGWSSRAEILLKIS